MAAHKKNTIETISSIPVTSKRHKKKLWWLKSENYNEVNINYIPVVNLSILKNIIDFIYTFLKIFLLLFSGGKEKKIIIVDILSLSSVLGSFLASKIIGIKIICIVTDMPGIDVFKKSLKAVLKAKLIKLFITRFDGYILITKQMNRLVNPLNKPYMIMEGLVDNSMTLQNNIIANKSK